MARQGKAQGGDRKPRLRGHSRAVGLLMLLTIALALFARTTRQRPTVVEASGERDKVTEVDRPTPAEGRPTQGIATRRRAFIEVIRVDLPTTGKTGSAVLNVWKYSKVRSQWMRQQYYDVAVGDAIGRVEHVGLETYDFQTNYRLKAVHKIMVAPRPEMRPEIPPFPADEIELEDVRTGESLRINNLVPPPELVAIKKNPHAD